jgi:hypothetical protein
MTLPTALPEGEVTASCRFLQPFSSPSYLLLLRSLPNALSRRRITPRRGFNIALRQLFFPSPHCSRVALFLFLQVKARAKEAASSPSSTTRFRHRLSPQHKSRLYSPSRLHSARSGGENSVLEQRSVGASSFPSLTSEIDCCTRRSRPKIWTSVDNRRKVRKNESNEGRTRKRGKEKGGKGEEGRERFYNPITRMIVYPRVMTIEVAATEAGIPTMKKSRGWR